MLSLDERLFSSFEDLSDGSSSSSPSHSDDADDVAIEKRDALSLNQNELLQEMESRKLHARGFFADDAKVLQVEFDKEHETFVVEEKKKRANLRMAAVKAAGLQKRRLQMETQLRDEARELDKDDRAEYWIRLVKEGVSPGAVRMQLNGVTARCLSKALWDCRTVTSLDVGHMALDDVAGSFLARALKNNRSVVKLDAEGNMFGPRTCKALADSLKDNDAVRHVNLDSNPLAKGSKGQPDVTGVVSLSSMLSTNSTLTYLNLWRCNIGSEGGASLTSGALSSSSLLFLDVGNNGFAQSHLRRIADKLDDNRNRYEARRSEGRALGRRADEESAVRRREEETKEEAVKLREWMEEQKKLRAETLRCEKEETTKRRLKEEETKRAEDAERLAKEAEAKAAAEAKKKKKAAKKK